MVCFFSFSQPQNNKKIAVEQRKCYKKLHKIFRNNDASEREERFCVFPAIFVHFKNCIFRAWFTSAAEQKHVFQIQCQMPFFIQEWVLISTIILLSLLSQSHDAWLNINALKHHTQSTNCYPDISFSVMFMHRVSCWTANEWVGVNDSGLTKLMTVLKMKRLKLCCAG